MDAFEYGEPVAVAVDWLGVPLGSIGEIVGYGFEDPVSYFVDFTRGVFPIPAIHLRPTDRPHPRFRNPARILELSALSRAV